MSDETDQAQAADEFHRNRAIAAAVSTVLVASTVPGCSDCIGCGEKISEARLRAVPSARRCAGCQALAERRKGVR